jgi:predicted benzoate:H+ symporter BenE
MNTKPFYTSKVFWLNTIAFIIAALALVQSSPVFPREWTDGLALLVAVLNLWLRWNTATPLTLTKDDR